MKSGAALVVLSCDKYADLWPPFFELFWKNWPDCPYRVYLVSNQVPYAGDARVQNILTGPDRNWSSSFKSALAQIPEELLFIWIEDAFLTAKVDARKFGEPFEFMERTGGNHIHFRPYPLAERWIEGGRFGVYELGQPYRVNLMGFWKKSCLSSLLLDGESPWNFEIMGSYRSGDGFSCVKEPLFDYVHMVDKGAWTSEAVEYCRRVGSSIDLLKRGRRGSCDKIILNLKTRYFLWMMAVNWRLRVKLMGFLRKLIVSY